MGTEALLPLILPLAVGRLCLSMLPPGWPGYHNRRELGATLCASLLLGLLALKLLPALWLWLVILVIRVCLLPGALRPRHELQRATGAPWALAFLAFSFALLAGSPPFLVVTLVLGACWLIAGITLWTRRADRRARSLAFFGVLTPLVLWLL
jgi:hypothetical protein